MNNRPKDKTFTPNDILFFWDGPLSQWRKAIFHSVEGVRYNCCEQYMMHQKALLFGDEATANLIMKAKTPKEQKALGRQVANYDQSKWDEHKIGIVWQGNFLRFSQNAPDRRFLLSTENKHLAEASPFDRIWGIGLSDQDPKIWKKHKWNGLNLLGEVLMSVRQAISLTQQH